MLKNSEMIFKAALLGVTSTVLLLLLGGTVWFFGVPFGLSALALGSMVVLLWGLVIFASLMNIVGLSDKTQALGLPEGSIRAIIAIALVGLFAVLAATVLSGHNKLLHPRASTDEVADFQARNPTLHILAVPNAAPTKKADGTQDPQTYQVFTPSAPADDFMKQMLTLVGTLMTAITAFYFGGRTANPSDPTRAPPKLMAVIDSPVELSQEPAIIKLSGADLNNVKSMSLSSGTAQRTAQSILSNSSQVHAVVAFSAEDRAAEKKWSVSVTDDIGRVATLENALTTKPKAPTSGG